MRAFRPWVLNQPGRILTAYAIYTPSDGSSLIFRKGSNLIAGQIDGNGAGGVNYKSSGSDFAEWLPRLDREERIEAGDIVGVFEGRISRKTAGANQVMVISKAPIVLGNSPPESEEHLYERVAFVGQAPVKVRGPVKAGDYIIASGLNDGTSVAVSPEEMTTRQRSLVVGQAWESSSNLGVKLVNTAVGLTLPGHQQLGREYVEYSSPDAGHPGGAGEGPHLY